MEKLSLELQALLLNQANQNKERTLTKESTDKSVVSDNTINVIVKYQNDFKPLEELGLKINTRVFNHIYGKIEITKLAQLATHPNVLEIDQPSDIRKHLDHSISNINASSVRSRSGSDWTGDAGQNTIVAGQNIIVGIIDTGIDYRHLSFRNTDAQRTTRILSIWDQTIQTPQGGESPPANYNRPPIGTATMNYGVEYSRTQINTALGNANPLSIVRHEDEDGHGTHVAGIAAGNGSQNGNCKGEFTFSGVAPKVDLIIVRMRGLTEGDPPRDGNELMDAILYIERAAGTIPVAINMSLGNSWGPRDGTDPTAVLLDQILNSRTAGGFILVKSAGNAGSDRKHAEANISPNGTVSIEFQVGNNRDFVMLEVRYTGSNLNASLTTPDIAGASQTTAVATIGSPVTSNLNNVSGTTDGNVMIQNTANRILVTFNPPSTASNLSGVWKINLINTTASATQIHSWLTSHDSAFPIFESNETPLMTLDPDSSGQDVIIVGAHAAKGSTSGQLADFSGRGPTFDGRTKPDLTAPGVAVTSTAIESFRHDDGCDCIANCCCTCCQDHYRDENGTSMAAPHVAGSVALLLGRNNALTFSQIKTILHDSSTGVDEKPNPNWGWGKLNVSAALGHALITPSPAPPVVVPFAAHTPPPQYPTLQTLQERLMSLPKGQHLRKIGIDLFEEIRTLINKNKRVATVWHRCAGPSWVRVALRLAGAPYEMIPDEMNGVKLTQGIDRMTQILTKYGSPLLVQNINEWQSELQILRGGMSIFQLYEMYEEQEMVISD